MQAIVKSLTNQQKQYIVELRLFECAAGQGGAKSLSVTKKFWARLGNRTWQTAGTKQLKNLCDKGYLKQVVGGNNTIFYSLTKGGRRFADSCIIDASQYQWEVEQPELLTIPEVE